MSKHLYFDSNFYNSTDSKKQFSINVFENTAFIQDSRDWQVALVKAQLPLNSPIMVIKETDPIYFQVRDIFGSTIGATSFTLSGSFYSPQELLDKINEKIDSELVNCPINGFYISSEGKLSFKTNEHVVGHMLTFNSIVFNLFSYNFDYIMKNFTSDVNVYYFDIPTTAGGIDYIATSDSLSQFYQWVSIRLDTDLPVVKTSGTFETGRENINTAVFTTKTNTLTSIDINRRVEDSYAQSLIYIPQVERYISLTGAESVNRFNITAYVEYVNGTIHPLEILPSGFGKIMVQFSKK
jgi:hypothetical protein